MKKKFALSGLVASLALSLFLATPTAFADSTSWIGGGVQGGANVYGGMGGFNTSLTGVAGSSTYNGGTSTQVLGGTAGTTSGYGTTTGYASGGATAAQNVYTGAVVNTGSSSGTSVMSYGGVSSATAGISTTGTAVCTGLYYGC